MRHAEPIPDGVASSGESPAEAAERSELRASCSARSPSCPKQQRWVVELFEIDGFTGPEIAAMLEMADGTVRWHLHEARQTLRTVLAHFAVRTS